MNGTKIANNVWMSGMSTGFGLLSTLGGAVGALKTQDGDSTLWVVMGLFMLAAGVAHWVYAWSLCRLDAAGMAPKEVEG